MFIYNKNNGFTLIELMIVVAIIGIIAGIAYPSFSDSMMKARRSDAKSAMLGLVLSQSKLRGSCATFGGTIGAANNCGSSTVKGIATSENGYYTLAISGAGGNAYTITATAQGVQAKDTGCTSLTLAVSASNPKGLKGPSSCW
ncbi:type IV pilin protein [Thalassotalea psychrophila]|uniref:Type IV pilin protein n=1 Tax=Thalassotalea psychrophila TaxID=3065647 RepID=A0ABY9TWW4_9GAMM|nr:type IV pilin protein [Colwelliaceae bacterium SQ149]